MYSVTPKSEPKRQKFDEEFVAADGDKSRKPLHADRAPSGNGPRKSSPAAGALMGAKKPEAENIHHGSTQSLNLGIEDSF